MTYIEAVRSGLQNYATFSGRAVRSEYWYWTLFNLLMSILAAIMDMVIGLGIFGLIVMFGLLLPSIAVSARRLHDIDRTAWWLLLAFTGVGCILLIIWACMKGTPGPNRFGPIRCRWCEFVARVERSETRVTLRSTRATTTPH